MFLIFFNEYHKHESDLIDYFLIDYIINLGYQEIPAIKTLIDNIPYSNPNLYYMQKNMDLTINEEELKQVLLQIFVFKLNWRMKPPTNKHALYYHLEFEKNK